MRRHKSGISQTWRHSSLSQVFALELEYGFLNVPLESLVEGLVGFNVALLDCLDDGKAELVACKVRLQRRLVNVL